MKTKHTPGPWTATSRRVTAPETEERLGLNVHIYGGNGQDNAANARLIAAAPDLLEALKAMLEVHGVRQEHAIASVEIPQSWVELSDVARAAIAKATGGEA